MNVKLHCTLVWVLVASALPLTASAADGGVDAGPQDSGSLEDAGPPVRVDAEDAGVTDGSNPDGGDEEDAEDEDLDEAVDDAEEEVAPSAEAAPGLYYSRELSDAELERRWREDPATLGSITVGFADEGRIINGVQMPEGDGWVSVVPDYAWGTQETIDYLTVAISAVLEQFPDSPPARVNHISKKEGGYLRPHQSHQSGRDVDLGFYYPGGSIPGGRAKEKVLDRARNWALLKAIITRTDAQVILVDRRVQKVLYDHALSQGEDKAWLDSIFHGGKTAMVKHARHHRDHFHVRFYSARSQELGRRVQPLLAQRPEQNITFHRVRRGDTLGAIARRYGTSVRAVQKANGMRNTFLRPGRSLLVHLRGACTRCPVPPPVVVPPRRLPTERAATVIPRGEETARAQ